MFFFFVLLGVFLFHPSIQYLLCGVVRGGILRGAAKKKKGQKKGRVVYKYVFGLLYEVFPIYRRDFTGPFLVFETRKKGALPRAPYNSLPSCGGCGVVGQLTLTPLFFFTLHANTQSSSHKHAQAHDLQPAPLTTCHPMPPPPTTTHTHTVHYYHHHHQHCCYYYHHTHRHMVDRF